MVWVQGRKPVKNIIIILLGIASVMAIIWLMVDALLGPI